MKKKNLVCNLENLKSYNPLNKASFWYTGLAEFVGHLSGFQCFIDWLKDARDSDCSAHSGWDERRMEDALSPKTDKKPCNYDPNILRLFDI